MKVDRYTLKVSEVMGIPLEEVTRELRQEGKRLFFMEMYNNYTNMIIPDIICMRDKTQFELDTIKKCILEELLPEDSDAVDKGIELEIRLEVLNDVLQVFEEKGKYE